MASNPPPPVPVAATPDTVTPTAESPNANQLRDQGLAALEVKDVEKADQLARAAIAADPDDPQTVFLMTFVLAEQNRFAEAIKMLDDLAEDVPTSRFPVLGQTAEWMVLQGRWLDAEERCYKILAELPDAVPAHRLLVQLFTREGRRWDAARHLHQLCRLGNIEEAELYALLLTFYSFSYDANEEEFEPIGDLGIAHYQISASDWGAAANTLKRLSDKNAAESALLGRVLAHRLEFDLLSEWESEVPDAAKKRADYWYAMGVLKANQGEHEAAVKNFCAAVLRDQTEYQAYSGMSRSLEEIGADPQAKEAANRAQMIERTQVIAKELVNAQQKDLQQMVELVDLLDQLQRPFEALAWKAVAIVYGESKVTESDAQALLAEINQSRVQLLQSNQSIPTRDFVLCGFDPEKLAESSDEATDAE